MMQDNAVQKRIRYAGLKTASAVMQASINTQGLTNPSASEHRLIGVGRNFPHSRLLHSEGALGDL